MLRDVDRAYVAGFRDGANYAATKAARTNGPEPDRSPRVGPKLVISVADVNRHDHDPVPLRHPSTMTAPPAA